jgi:hypothetical protein
MADKLQFVVDTTTTNKLEALNKRKPQLFGASSRRGKTRRRGAAL